MFPFNIITGKRWPVNVKIRIARKNGEEWFFDRARRVTDKVTRKEYYQLRKTKAKAKPALFKNMVKTNCGLWTEFFSPSPHEFYPCQIVEKDGDVFVADGALEMCDLAPETRTKVNGKVVSKYAEVQPMDEDQKMFWADVVHHANSRWQKTSWWERYGGVVLPVIAIAMIGFAFLFMSYAWANYVVPGMNQLGSGVSALGNQFEKLAEIYQQIYGAAKTTGMAGMAPPG